MNVNLLYSFLNKKTDEVSVNTYRQCETRRYYYSGNYDEVTVSMSLEDSHTISFIIDQKNNNSNKKLLVYTFHFYNKNIADYLDNLTR